MCGLGSVLRVWLIKAKVVVIILPCQGCPQPLQALLCCTNAVFALSVEQLGTFWEIKELLCFHERPGLCAGVSAQEHVLTNRFFPFVTLVCCAVAAEVPVQHHCIQHGLQGRSSFIFYFSFKTLCYLIAF